MLFPWSKLWCDFITLLGSTNLRCEPKRRQKKKERAESRAVLQGQRINALACMKKIYICFFKQVSARLLLSERILKSQASWHMQAFPLLMHDLSILYPAKEPNGCKCSFSSRKQMARGESDCKTRVLRANWGRNCRTIGSNVYCDRTYLHSGGLEWMVCTHINKQFAKEMISVHLSTQ